MMKSFENSEKKSLVETTTKALLTKHNITEEDYRYLLKYYYTIENIVRAEENEIKRLLKDYYYSKLYTLQLVEEKMSKKDSEKTIMSGKSTYFNSFIYATYNGEIYWQCYIPEYGTWWFHEDSGTHIGTNNVRAGNRTQDVFDELYGRTDIDYHDDHCWQLWGERYNHSVYSYTAHEGLDIGIGTGTRLDAITKNGATTTVKRVTDGFGAFTYYVDYYGIIADWTVFLLHTRTYTGQPQIGDTISDGNKIAEESSKGAGSSVHTHFSVNRYLNTTYAVYEFVGLESDSPYDFIEYYK